MLIDNIDFQKEFFELFKLSDSLVYEINKNKKDIGGSYVSVTFRFQQLLGDFKEGNYAILNETERKELMEKCLNFVQIVKNKHHDIKKILVTSDSRTFLDIVNIRYDYVYTIPGTVVHIDYTNDANNLSYLKSFVDLLMLAGADFLYSYATGPMYKDSGFAVLASKIGGKPIERVVEE